MNDTFTPQGKSYTIYSSSVATVPVQISTGDVFGFRVVNQSTVDVYLAIGKTTATAVAPTTATPSYGILIPGTYHGAEYFKCNGRPYLSVISTIASVIGSLNVTPGMKL